MRKDRSFDDIIKDKLNNVTPAYQPENWERFRERLAIEKQEPTQDTEFFDRLVRQKTPATNNSGFSSNWTALVSRLELMYRREKELVIAKLLELAALCLLFWVVDVQLLPLQNYETVFHAAKVVTLQSDTLTRKELPTNSNHPIETNAGAPTPKPFNHLIGVLAITTSDKTTAAKNIYSDESSPITNKYLLEAATYLVPLIQVHLPEPLVSTWEMPRFRFSEYAFLDDLPPNNKSKRLTISMFGSTDINNIYTPGSIEGPFSELDRTTIEIPSLQRFSPGYGGGITIGVEKGRWETEVGLIYTAKIYQARPVLYVTGSVREGFSAEGLKDIELNMVAVPFQLKYNLLQKNGWRVYAAGGLSLHLVLESNYLLADQDAFKSRSFNLSLPDEASSGLPKSRGLNSKNLEGGWLQGGGFSKNAYITGIISAGAERKFNNGWSLFVQPTYQHSLYYFSKGIGPDKDRIHTFSLMSGVRIRL